jgi:Domain of unknown function (DUF1905)
MSGRKRTSKVRFEAELIEGHKGVTPVSVPFDPEEQWGSPPVRLDARRDGWLVRGKANGTPFEGYIGVRWGRFFLIVDAELRATLDVNVGDVLSIVVEPTMRASALAKAREQCKVTTAPKKGRPDAIVLP